jgi:hypothetical protein
VSDLRRRMKVRVVRSCGGEVETKSPCDGKAFEFAPKVVLLCVIKWVAMTILVQRRLRLWNVLLFLLLLVGVRMKEKRRPKGGYEEPFVQSVQCLSSLILVRNAMQYNV